MRRLLTVIVLAGALCGALAYLRDPPWLESSTSGLRGWETDATGVRCRWTGGHASLFVPSSAHTVSIPLRTTFDAAGDQPVTVNISIDDRPVDRIVLTDPRWHVSTLRLPPAGGRRVRRIDIRVDRTREDNRGAAVGELVIGRTARGSVSTGRQILELAIARPYRVP